MLDDETTYQGPPPIALERDPNDVTPSIQANKRRRGILPQCRRCRRACKQYRAAGLTRMVCPASPDYEAERAGWERGINAG